MDKLGNSTRTSWVRATLSGSQVLRGLWDALVLAYESLRVNRLRTGLTALGMAIGSGSVILVVTIALTSREYVLNQIEGVGSNLIFAYLQGTEGVAGTQTRGDALTVEDLHAIRQQVPNLRAVAAVTFTREEMRVGSLKREVALVGTSPDLRAIRNLGMLAGRFFDQADDAQRNRVCVVTETLARELYPEGWKQGSRVKVRGIDFTVIGVFRGGSAAFGPSEITRETVVIPLSLMRFFTGSEAVARIYASAERREDVAGATDAMAGILRTRHRGNAVYSVENLAVILDTADQIATALTLVLILISAICLLVGGIGIMTIMMVAVTERTSEIGLRMALGATRNAIRLQFLAEAVFLSLGGSLIGILGGAGLPILARYLLEGVDIPMPWLAVLVALLVSCSCGIVFGMLPAQRASRLAPTEALRHE